MAIVAKWLTHRIVAPAFVSSILIGRPIFWAMAKWLRHRTLTPGPMVRIHLAQPFAGVAELADALDLGSSSSECRFDSCHPHHMNVKAETSSHKKSNPIWIAFFH